MNAALSPSDRASLSLFSAARGGGNLLGAALAWADSVEHRWNLWVIGYDDRFQSRVLKDLLGEREKRRNCRKKQARRRSGV